MQAATKRKLRAVGWWVGVVLLLILTWCIRVYHIGALVPPEVDGGDLSASKFFDRSKYGIHHLFVRGNAYERGMQMGQLTGSLIDRQEKMMVSFLQQSIPSPFVQRLLVLGAIRWFWGLDHYFSDWMREEIFGVSKGTSKDLNYLADRYTRQLAYHGVHEVGQMMVDRGGDNFGCTSFVVPKGSGWIIGRNFDFAVGRVFDEEKIVKWVYPDEGFAYVSVVWAGMVGVVTGINAHGVYIAINAAGTSDFERHGTPSTLVVADALMKSKNAEEARSVIEEAKVFISDIYVVSDSEGAVYRIEKSPKRVATIEMNEPSVVTTHFVDEVWKNDRTNQYRKEYFTTATREARGKQLLETAKSGSTFNVNSVLNFLRDKQDLEGGALNLGNQQAIDLLIASHSVIYDTDDGILYVSQGPGVSGPFLGYDLKQSFYSGMPVLKSTLKADASITPEEFYGVRATLEGLRTVRQLQKQGNCKGALEQLEQMQFKEHSDYYTTLGNVYECLGNGKDAKKSWEKALSLKPAYKKQKDYLESKVKL